MPLFSPICRLVSCSSVVVACGLAVPSAWSQTPAVVINEIHYAEDDATVHSEFVELHNAGSVPVDLGGWFFDSGVPFVFPAGVTIAPGGFVVVCEDPATLQAKWGISPASVHSWNQGVTPPVWNRLGNGGDSLVLRTATGAKVDEVEFQLGFPWPTVGDPPNYSIELINPALDNSLGGHWRPSDGGQTSLEAIAYVPSASAQWHYRKATSEPSDPVDAWRAEGFAEDASWLTGTAPFGYGDPSTTVLSDMRGSGQPGYTSIHMRHTFTVSGSVPGPLKLSVVNDDGFIAWINGVEVARFGPAAGAFIPYNGTAGRGHEGYNQPPDVVTISAPNSILHSGTNVLAIHALNESLAGSSDFHIDATLRFDGGTAGAGPTPLAANSTFAANAPPAIRQVAHAPVSPVVGQEWPHTGQDVRVTAKITDPNGVGSVELLYQMVEPGDFVKVTDPRYEQATSWTTVAMNDAGTDGDEVAGDSVFSGVVPGSVQSHRRLIRYRLRATDGGGLTVRVPYADDPQPNFAWFVHDGVPSWTGKATPTSPDVVYGPDVLSSVATYHLITRVEEHANAQNVPITNAAGATVNPTAGSYGHSDYLWQGALAYDGKVYDHIRFRARGGVWRFSMGKNMWKFDFNKGHDFQARDNRGRAYGQRWKKLNFSACIQQGDFNHRGEQGLFESVGFRLFQLTGLEAENTNFVHFRIVERPDETNGTASQFDDDFQGLYLAIEQQDGQFLDEHDLPDGNLYKMEGGSGELNNQGPSQPKNKSDLNAFIGSAGYGGTNGASEAWWRTNVELADYYNYRVIVEAIHHYDIGDGKNYFYYNNPDTAKWQQLPWDLDLTWADNMYGSGNEPFLSRIFGNGSTTGIAPLRTELRNRARELLDLLFNAEQTGMLIDEMASFIWQPGQPSFVDADRAMWDYNPILVSGYVNSSKAGHGRFYQSGVDNPATTTVNETRTFAGMAQKMKNYVATRRAYITSQVLGDEALVPTTPVITRTAGGAGPLPADALAFTSSPFAGKGGATFSAMQWRLAEITDPTAPDYMPYDHTKRRRYEAEAVWTSPELPQFASGITMPGGAVKPDATYRARVRHKDSEGRWSHWSTPVTFTAGVPDVTPWVDALVVSQFMYHPAPPDATESPVAQNAESYEWIELMNVSAAPVDLTPLRFSNGVEFDFSTGSVPTLAPGARVLVVANAAAFEARYGTGKPVAGEYSGSLNNAGETIRLSHGPEVPVIEFAYDDAAPWPAEADGSGVALVLVAPETRPDHASPTSWRASAAVDGTPGASDALTYAAWLVENPAASAEDDADGDGLSHFAEYALGGNPTQASQAPLPTGQLVDDPGGAWFGFSFVRRATADDVEYIVEHSDDAASWSTEGVEPVSQTLQPDGTVLCIHRVTVGEADRAFVRLRVRQRP